jgi:hypothetical protein
MSCVKARSVADMTSNSSNKSLLPPVNFKPALRSITAPSSVNKLALFSVLAAVAVITGVVSDSRAVE